MEWEAIDEADLLTCLLHTWKRHEEQIQQILEQDSGDDFDSDDDLGDEDFVPEEDEASDIEQKIEIEVGLMMWNCTESLRQVL